MGEASCLLLGMQRGRSPLAKPASAMRWREVERMAEGHSCNITWLASFPKRSCARFRTPAKRKFSGRYLPDGDAVVLALAKNHKCALAKTAGRSALVARLAIASNAALPLLVSL